MGRFFSDNVKKKYVVYFGLFNPLCIHYKNTASNRQISFLYVDIWFDVAKCKFTVKKNGLNCWTQIVADTKITFVYNFVAAFAVVAKTI